MALRERSFVRMSAILAISLQSGAGSGAVSTLRKQKKEPGYTGACRSVREIRKPPDIAKPGQARNVPLNRRLGSNAFKRRF